MPVLSLCAALDAPDEDRWNGELRNALTPANVHDTFGARCLLAGLKYFVPRLTKIWADQAYQGPELADWCQATGNWELEVVKRL